MKGRDGTRGKEGNGSRKFTDFSLSKLYDWKFGRMEGWKIVDGFDTLRTQPKDWRNYIKNFR